MTEKSKSRQYLAGIVLFSILFLFFFQLLTDFVESIYAFGLMGTGIPMEIVAVLLFFSPAVLLLRKKGISGWSFIFLGELVILTRVLEVVQDTRFRMLVSGLGVACFLIFLPSLLWNLGRDKRNPDGWVQYAGLSAAVFLAILLRAVNSGIDLSTETQFAYTGWILAAVGAILLVIHYRPRKEIDKTGNADTGIKNTPGPGFGLVSGLKKNSLKQNTNIFLL